MQRVLVKVQDLSKNESFIQLIKYGLIGLLGLVVDFGSYYVMTTVFKMIPEIANFISSSLGLINNFFWNSFANFKVHDHMVIRFIKYYLVGQTTTLFTTGCLFVFVTLLHQNQLIVKAVSTLVATLIQFIINKVFTFKKN